MPKETDEDKTNLDILHEAYCTLFSEESRNMYKKLNFSIKDGSMPIMKISGKKKIFGFERQDEKVRFGEGLIWNF